MQTSVALRVQRIEEVALDVKRVVLCHAQNQALPAFEAGAHIELLLAPQLVRSYSLLNTPGVTDRYEIAVHLHPDSRGGSRHVHEVLQVGDALWSSSPRNNFPLHEDAARSCLIAGGIGITPLLSMVRRLSQMGRPWQLHYCARTARHAAFLGLLQELAAASGNQVFLHFDQEPGGSALRIGELVRETDEDTHFYCCGPVGMLADFEACTAHCAQRAHVEYFSARQQAAVAGGYTVELARSGRVLVVPAGRTILDVVLEAGIDVSYSCCEGICGSCETTILAGQADHRDALLTPEERQAQQSMMICCSGALSPLLVLDL